VALSITAAPPGLLPGLLVALGTGLLAGELTGLLMGLLMGLLAMLVTANGNPAAARTGWGAMTGRPRKSI
jgi:hypothetical protein